MIRPAAIEADGIVQADSDEKEGDPVDFQHCAVLSLIPVTTG